MTNATNKKDFVLSFRWRRFQSGRRSKNDSRQSGNWLSFYFFVFGPADSAKWERALKCAGPTVLRGVWQRPRYLYYILRNFKISRNSCFSEILFLMWSSQLCLAIFVWADLRPSPQFFLSQIGFLTLLLTRNVNDKNFSQIQTYKNKNTVVPISILGRSESRDKELKFFVDKMLRKRPRKNEWKKELFCNKICRIDLACFLSVSLSWWKFSQCTVSVLNTQLTHSPFSLSHTFTSRYLSLSQYLHGSFLSLKPYIAFSLSHEHSSQFLHTYSIHRKRCIIHTPLKYTLWHFTHCLSLSLSHSFTNSVFVVIEVWQFYTSS